MQLDFFAFPPAALAAASAAGADRLAAGAAAPLALVPAAVAPADRAIGAHYTARLDTLQQEKFCPAPASCRISRCFAENRALRQLVNSGRTVSGAVPARVTTRRADGFTLACPGAATGQSVLDAGGRYAGSVTAVEGDCCTVTFAATAGLCGAYAGLVTPGQWVLTGLPADCALAAGDIVTTPAGTGWAH